MNPQKILVAVWIAALAIVSADVRAAPFSPANDNEVVDKLPVRVSGATADPARESRRAQALLNGNRRNLDLALHVAQLNIRRARGEADPRYLGQAQAALAPWWNEAKPPVAVQVLRATIRQSLHQFAAARADLEDLVAREPNHAQAWLTLATVQQVTGDMDGARSSCTKLVPLAAAPVHTACVASVDGSTGRANTAAAALARSLQTNTGMNNQLRLWMVTLQAELAERSGQPGNSERLYLQALQLDKRDAYANAAYADFLLDQNRAADVLKLIPAESDSDLLLLRRTLAAQVLKRTEAAALANNLTARYEAARARNERLHLREEARFLLHVRNQPAEALKLAVENWQTQKEPADLRILLEAANAAGERAIAKPAAQEALAWLKRTQLEGRVIAQLAKRAQQI
jgi:hypothetical protein